MLETHDGELSRAIQRLNGRYALRFNRRYDRDAHLFKNRFGAVHQQSESQLIWTLRYIVMNPVEKGLCGARRSGDGATIGLQSASIGLHDSSTSMDFYRSSETSLNGAGPSIERAWTDWSVSTPGVTMAPWSSSPSTAGRSARPRASCSSTRRAARHVHRRSATTRSSTRTAAAGCASSTSKERAAAAGLRNARVAEGMSVSTNGPITEFQRTLTEMLSEHLNESPGGRLNSSEPSPTTWERPHHSSCPTRSARSTTTATGSWATTRTRASCATAAFAHRRSCSAPRSPRGRGGPRIVPTWELSWLDTECELCGGCLSVCPTGAIYEKFEEGRPQPEHALEQVRTTCTFCGVGCQIDLNLDPQTKHIVKVTSKDEYLPNEGNLCVKGRFAFNFGTTPTRLRCAAARAR